MEQLGHGLSVRVGSNGSIMLESEHAEKVLTAEQASHLMRVLSQRLSGGTMNEQPEKRKRGRKPLDKATRAYTIDRKIAEFLDSLPEGERSQFVNEWLRQHPQIAGALRKKE